MQPITIRGGKSVTILSTPHPLVDIFNNPPEFDIRYAMVPRCKLKQKVCSAVDSISSSGYTYKKQIKRKKIKKEKKKKEKNKSTLKKLHKNSLKKFLSDETVPSSSSTSGSGDVANSGLTKSPSSADLSLSDKEKEKLSKKNKQAQQAQLQQQTYPPNNHNQSWTQIALEYINK
ncbi:hypothetical protein ACTFIR_002294 [Dictyostelium discoideum]